MRGLLPGMHIFRIYSGASAEIVRMQYVARKTTRDWHIGQSISATFEIRDHENKVLENAKVRSDFGLREATSNEKGIAVLHGIPSGGVLLPLIGLIHGFDEVEGMVVGNKLQGIGNAIDKVVLSNDGHVANPCTVLVEKQIE